VSATTQAPALEVPSPGVSDRVTDTRNENDGETGSADPQADAIRDAVQRFHPKARERSTRILEICIEPSGNVVVSEAEPPPALVRAIEAQVLADVRDRVVRALDPLPAEPKAGPKAPPPVPTKPVSVEDRERARRALARVGIPVRRGDGS